ncbi:MAG: acylneuraminate cytidylyltransferase family protein [Bacteroidota bacterium]
MFQHKTIAFIPARGGSKRLPGKNLKSFVDNPLLYYSIDYAKKANLFEEIVLSSDELAILSYGEQQGITPLPRPSELSGDHATTASAAQHALIETERITGQTFDFFVTLQPTNPLRSLQVLTKALTILSSGQYDSVMTVSRNHKKFGTISDNLYQAANYAPGQRSQDMKDLYFENGMLYCSMSELVRNGELFGEKVYALVTDDLFGMIDIDTQFDFEVAELLYKKFHNKIK